MAMCFLMVALMVSLQVGVVGVRGQDVPADITQSLLVLIQEEETIRLRLEEDLDQMEKDLTTLSILQNNMTCGCPGQQEPVVFSAVLTNDISSLGVQQQIPFDRILTNVGGAYDPRHGEFRAPVAGTYHFSVSLYVKLGIWAGIEIVVDGSPIARVRSGDSQINSMAGTSVTAYLTSGQDVWVEHIPEADSNAILGQNYTAFTGHLIQLPV